MKKRFQVSCFVVISLIFLPFTIYSQREFKVNDSTFHYLNVDTTLVVGRTRLYSSSPISGLNQIHDFTTTDTNIYIRDFDIVSDSIWYSLIGSRYVGDSTHLYKTINKGQSWFIDTSYYASTRAAQQVGGLSLHNSLNQIQQLSGDTLLLFAGYYQSGVFYSLDKGITWNIWFTNLQSHYHGLIECNLDYILIWIKWRPFSGNDV